MIEILDTDAVAQLLEHDIPAWQAGRSGFMSCLFDLMVSADSFNRHKLNQVYPLEMKAFKRWEVEK